MKGTKEEDRQQSMTDQSMVARAKRIENDARIDEFVGLFRQYGETVLNFISKSVDREVDPQILTKVNQQVEPMLRQRIETLVKDYMRTAVVSLTGEEVNVEEVGYRVQFPRRRRYLLRFVALAFADLIAFDEKQLALVGEDGKVKKGEAGTAVFPRAILDGVDAWIRQSLERGDVGKANMAAFRALDRLDITSEMESSESDRDLWKRVHERDDAMLLVGPVLLPLLRPFEKNFEAAKDSMQRLISSGSAGRISLNAQMWDLLFARIFGRLLRQAGGEGEDDKIHPEVKRIVTSVAGKYRKWRSQNQLK